MPIRLYPNNLIHTMQSAFTAMDQDRTTSPTLFFPSTDKHNFDYFTTSQSVQSPLSSWSMSTSTDITAITKPKRPTLSSNPSRKRSRDHIDDEEFAPTPAETNGLAMMEVIEEPIYGPGMTLLNPSTGQSIAAESQSGTWLEEKAESERIAEEKRIEAQRPILRPSKSSRLDIAAAQAESPVASTPVEVTIDPASALLGVGWKITSSPDSAAGDSDIAQALRGWARYIENHYPLQNVQIISKSESKEAFLVQADEGFWLFKEDLDEGRLISISWQGCVAGLTQNPMKFEGADTITAGRTPSPARDEGSSLAGGVEADAVTGMDLD